MWPSGVMLFPLAHNYDLMTWGDLGLIWMSFHLYQTFHLQTNMRTTNSYNVVGGIRCGLWVSQCACALYALASNGYPRGIRVTFCGVSEVIRGYPRVSARDFLFCHQTPPTQNTTDYSGQHQFSAKTRSRQGCQTLRRLVVEQTLNILLEQDIDAPASWAAQFLRILPGWPAGRPAVRPAGRPAGRPGGQPGGQAAGRTGGRPGGRAGGRAKRKMG